MKKFIGVLAILLLLSGNLPAQSEVEMADSFRAQGKIYVVVAIMVVIFAGIVAYLFVIDRKVSRLENGGRKN